MTEDNYKKALADAQDELENLTIQRERIDKRITQLQETVVSLSRLIQDETGDETEGFEWGASLRDMFGLGSGLTDAVRSVLKAEADFMTPVNVRDKLLALGYNFGDAKNILPSLHTILKRLEDKDEVRAGVTPSGKTAYIWKQSSLARAVFPDIQDPMLEELHEKQNQKMVRDAVREFLKEAEGWQYPPEIARTLSHNGVYVEPPEALLNYVKAALTTLAKNGEAQEEIAGDSKAYIWKDKLSDPDFLAKAAKYKDSPRMTEADWYERERQIKERMERKAKEEAARKRREKMEEAIPTLTNPIDEEIEKKNAIRMRLTKKREVK
jgi:hypothetical protein